MGKHTVNYGDKIIEFELERKNVKNINLNIKPDMTIVVTASEEVPLDYILRFVKSKTPWIIKNVSYFKETQPEYITNKKYISGESFKYLGKQYRLKVEETDEREYVKYYHGYIHIYIRDKNNYEAKKSLLNNWFRIKAFLKFEESLERIYPIVEKYGIEKPKINIRVMKLRWGSCIKDKKTILLNYELIKAPSFCIDYVMLHELIHFKYSKHNIEFYTFMTSLMPDWKMRKELLDEEVVREL
ncbi:M48 family metallopeptidase [Acetivibrio cellulolyticus]|uniref:M48 family metallopeptidase n=1 Tax=Acetivibrio cellulolyticus TaxID=35830 RepID=UPI0001E2BE6A|nr:SprT family zinc-dependent metalloprotease [Acetivibrio cellulolyticus]